MHERERTFMDDVKEVGAFFWLGLGITIGFLLATVVIGRNYTVPAFIKSLMPEAIGILFTVIVIDQLAERRTKRIAREELKQRLIRQMSSHINYQAIRAVERLREEGWLEDGSLKGVVLAGDLQTANFSEASLQGADFAGVNLQEASFWAADLQRADLWQAKLQGANLSEAKLKGAKLTIDSFDENTIMPDTFKWTPSTDLNRFTDPNHPNFFHVYW